jgi:hypothetical protein
MVCHNGKVICVEPASVQDHLNHGDRLNSCDSGARITDTSLAGRSPGYIIVYPNPVVANLKVRVSKVEEGATIQLYDPVGVLVRTVKLVDAVQAVSVRGLPGGIYLVMVRNGDHITTRKILVQ